MKKQFLILVLSFFCFSSLTAAQTYKVGQTIEVKWKGYWHQATIKTIKDESYQIHYCGMEDSWDEWVPTSRMRTDFYKTGDQVEVYWKEKYIEARILKETNGKYYVHYIGYDSSWNEWVPCERIRKST